MASLSVSRHHIDREADTSIAFSRAHHSTDTEPNPVESWQTNRATYPMGNAAPSFNPGADTGGAGVTLNTSELIPTSRFKPVGILTGSILAGSESCRIPVGCVPKWQNKKRRFGGRMKERVLSSCRRSLLRSGVLSWTADSEDIDVKDIDQILRDLEEKW